jgi:phospholipid transport system substrate-binding protein
MDGRRRFPHICPMHTRRLALGLPLLLAASPILAQADAAAPVERWHAALLGVMRDAQRLGVRGRFEQLAQPMAQSFDLSAMTRIAVGPPWTGLAPAEQQALTEAFARWSIAIYAARFDGFAGESFTTQGSQALPNGDVLVRTTLNRPNGEPVVLSYLVRMIQGVPRIVDVYLTGTISELAARRSEFNALMRDGGAGRVTQELQRRAAALLAA